MNSPNKQPTEELRRLAVPRASVSPSARRKPASALDFHYRREMPQPHFATALTDTPPPSSMMLLETLASKRYLEQRRALVLIAAQALESVRELDASEADRLEQLRALHSSERCA